ncbi:hypothetical protein PTTG_30090 [Puccinia triticina 1-1 BBBD Race 1]|uniref:Uncharacterized protein n=1 Tax=Puccinia triticina (isolate 1-1 / race 1 (BBBD)) TaxID=630390 RepID=A0A180G0F7_PUCT1|nr:hypothetical protein PTTG_30090 [Puccinia triticina 1-1 BBBD Race 1]
MANRSNRLTANANKTDDFFMVTRRVSVNRDAPDNPPTGNAPDATQESVLGPSQAGIPEGQSCRLFHEPEGSDDGNAANGSQLPPDASGSNPTATPNGENPPPVAGAARGPRPIQILHHVFMRTAAGQLAQAGARTPAAAAAKEWERVIPRGTAVLLTDIQNSTWPQFKLGAMDAVDRTIPLLGAHLKSLDAQRLLQWQAIIMKHATYSAKSNAMVTSKADFAQFAGAVMENPLSKVQVKISMNDPRRTAREQQQERAQQDTLAMSYGPEDTRLALERAQARLALNPRADVNAARRLTILADLTRHLIAKYGGNAESLRIQDPQDANRSIRVGRECLHTWSRAILHDAPGVDFDHPPRGPEFIIENVRVPTLAELAAQQTARLSRHRHDEAASGPAMTGRPAHSATNSHPRVNPPTSPDRSAGLQPAQRAPEPDPGLAARVFTPARGPSTPGARVVSPARRSLSGRFLPARVGPQATPTGAGTRTPSDAAHSPVTRRGSHATTALPLVPSPSPLGSPAAAPGANLDAVAGAPDAGPGAETDELESIQPDASSLHAGSNTTHPLSDAGSDIEILAGPPTGAHRSPARKILRSPAGDGIAHTISRLSFGRHQSPPASSPPPPRKVPLSRSESSNSWIGKSSPDDRLRLNAAGTALTIKGFLRLCNFDKEDPVPRALIQMAHICRWDYFLDTTPADL